MAQWYGLTQEEVLKRLGTNRTGLNEKEAERRLETYGENVLKEQEEMPWWQVFLGQFKDLLVMILIGGCGGIHGYRRSGKRSCDLSVLLLNAILGTVEHQKARKSLESLKRLASPETLLIREGRVCTAPSSRVVPGISWFWKQEEWYLQTAGSFSPAALPATKVSLQEKL